MDSNPGGSKPHQNVPVNKSKIPIEYDNDDLSDEEDIFSESDFDYSSELEDLWNRKTSRENSLDKSPGCSTLTTCVDQVVPMIIDTDEELW